MRRLAKFLVTACILAAAVIAVWQFLLKPQWELSRYPMAFTELVEQNAVEFGVPRELVFGVILTESGFDPNAVSRSGAKGLMQLIDETNEWAALMMGEKAENERIFEPELNIRRGTWLLARLYREFGSWREALAAYNAGIGRVRGWLDDPAYTTDGKTLSHIPIGETRAYVDKVMKAAEKYKEIYY
ncbi:MAG: lytic transglycosylase domain-containing protein [Ruminococcaceae bacterium]|nr:lytic transglycosylase domain-containing protein [Oscillospiraceae bacterium]